MDFLLLAYIEGASGSRSSRNLIHAIDELQLNNSTTSELFRTSLDDDERTYANPLIDDDTRCAIEILILIFYGGKSFFSICHFFGNIFFI